jgi:plastocyanin
MSRRARHLSLYLAALAAGVLVALAVSASADGGAQPPPSASFTARDNAWEVTGSSATTATIATGGTVFFSYPSGSNVHNVDFTGLAPSSCTQTAGTNLGAVPPLPASAAPPGWTGHCQFNTPGTYAFVCDAHSYMQGTIQVGDGSGSPPGSPPGTPTTPTTPTTPGSGSPGEAAPPTVKVARRQRGTTVRGSVTTSVGGSRLVIRALVSNRLLTTSPPRRVRKVAVGSLRRQVPSAGRTPFAVKLNRAARRALNRRDRLIVDLRISVTPPGGTATTKTARVILRPAA